MTLPTKLGCAGTFLVAPSPFFNAQWRQHCNGSECVQLFAELAPRSATVHVIISRADLSAEAKKFSLQYGSELKQLLAQVSSCHAGKCGATCNFGHYMSVLHA